MAATNEQVQNYVDQRVRPRAEQIRSLYLRCKDDQAALGDIFANLISSPDWVDNRPDSPPHMAIPNDVFAWNIFAAQFIAFVEGTFPDVATANSASAHYPVIQQLCVRPIEA